MANILVVDDEMGIRELLSEILSDEGHVVRTAENAQQARQARAEETPDLVLLDIWMPDTDGVTLLKEWQRDGLLTMSVIMMSGHATIDTAVEATRIGALNFLEKPIALNKLLQAIEHGLARNQERARSTTLSPLTQPAQREIRHMPPTPATIHHPAPALHVPLTPQPTQNTSLNTMSLTFDAPLRQARDMFERFYFEHHLMQENGSMTRVAEKTGLERTHLYRKLKQLGIEPTKTGKKKS